MRWRDEQAVTQALQDLREAPKGVLDEAIIRALNAGANFREIAQAAEMSVGGVHKRAIKYRQENVA